MIVMLNGQQKEFTESTNLNDIIKELSIKKDLVVAEVNGDIIKKQDWDQKKIQSGDTVELVNFVGGGR